MSLEVSRLLDAAAGGDRQAASDLLPLVYAQLRQLAAMRMSQEPTGQTLQATALVHEAYLRLVGSADHQRWQGRGHFFAAAAEAMRRILVEQARRKKRVKHGGNRHRVELEDVVDLDSVVIEPSRGLDDLLVLDAALHKLSKLDGTAAELIQLRYFAGLTVADAAELMNISVSTAERVWRYARAWLHQEIQGQEENV